MSKGLWSIWTYPWDVMDEGVDTALRNIVEVGGLNCISLTSNYHTTRALLPHNPKRKVYFNQSGATYFKPDPARYGRIQPFLASDLNGRDIFDEVAQRIGHYGLQLKSWTICCHSTGIGLLYPDCTLENAFGDHYLHSLNPAHPDVRAYLVGMVGDLAARYPLQAIELEAPGYMGFKHGFHHEKTGVPLAPLDEFYLNLTFSDYDRRAVAEAGGNTDALRQRVIAHLKRTFNEDLPHDRPDAGSDAVDQLLHDDLDLQAYMQSREKTVTSLFAEMAEAVQESPGKTQLLAFVGLDPVVGEGLNVPDILDSIGGVLAGTYTTPPDQCASVITGTRDLLQGKPLSVTGMVNAIYPITKRAADIGPKVAALRAAGVDGINFYNYGLMRLANLNAIRDALS